MGDKLAKTLWACSLVITHPIRDVHPDAACSNLLVNGIFFLQALNILQLNVDAARIEDFMI
jgi:hypothetical protein